MKNKFRYHWINLFSIVFTVVYVILVGLVFLFCPDYLRGLPKTNWIILHEQLDYWKMVFYLCTWGIFLIFLGFFFLACIRNCLMISFAPWFMKKHYAQNLKIINCAKIDLKTTVAYIQAVCQDFVETTFEQVMNQTFIKNVDLYLLDDSSDPEYRKYLDDYATRFFNKYNKPLTIVRRTVEQKKLHPSKMGNTRNFLDLYAKKYDFICETDASSVLSNNFIEESLKYYFNPYLNADKIGFIVGNGNYFPSRNFFSNCWSLGWQFSIMWLRLETMTLGSVLSADGWGTFYKTTTLDQIPIKDVECPSCDYARGLWLLKNGYQGIYCPFIYTGKVGAQSIADLCHQRCKWATAGHFIMHSSLMDKMSFNAFISNSFPHVSTFFMAVYLYTVIWKVIDVIFFRELRILFLSPALTIGCAFLFPFAGVLIYFLVKKYPVWKIIFAWCILSLISIAITFKIMYVSILKTLLLHQKWSSKYVIKKSESILNWKQKFGQCKWYIFSLLLSTVFFVALYQLLRFYSMYVTYFDCVFSDLIILYIMIAAPMIVYIFLVFMAFRTKKGWDFKSQIDIEQWHFFKKWDDKLRNSLIAKQES